MSLGSPLGWSVLLIFVKVFDRLRLLFGATVGTLYDL